MVETNSSILNKTYKKLFIQVHLNGLSFCVKDQITKTIEVYQEASFEAFDKARSIEENLKLYLSGIPDLQNKMDEVLILHDNVMNTFVPKSLFDENYLGTYLQYNTKVFDTDYFTYDQIESADIVNVYIPYVNFNNFFIEQFGSFEYKHLSSIFIASILEKYKNHHDKMMFAYIQKNCFQLIVLNEGRLQLHNHFNYKTKEDFIYYILFTAEQLHLNPENFKLELLGEVNENDELFKMAYTYIREVKLFEAEDHYKSSFSKAINRKHNLLFES